ncbi:SDR family NAD(P)-dependent oxidoreductase [Xanthomonas cannabis]|uniref:SDR family NAD(P)-dependent oxidoreductase n=1 Tax=Xanthomonas cannabis TaxID=1885674 RepID=UPI0022A95656|nr:SDR family NAD(P)-dependent oxidoreductase [Xanthomonas cannabis]
MNKAFFITRQVAFSMIGNARPGAIANIGSMRARQAIAATPSSVYSMAKAGLPSLTQHLAMALPAHDIASMRCPSRDANADLRMLHRQGPGA